MPTLIQALDQLICHGREEIWHTDRTQALDQCPQKVDQCPQKEGVCQRVSTGPIDPICSNYIRKRLGLISSLI